MGRCTSFLLSVAWLAVYLATWAAAQPTPCDTRATGQDAVSTALYCLSLVPTPAVDGAAGTVELGRGISPFSVAVTPDGHMRYNLTFALKGLPDPATLGPYTAYVAWATTPVLDPMVKLGTVGNGRFALGEVAFNKFLILVTAEASPDVTTRTGRLVLRARSPSSLMEVHDLVTTAPTALLPPDSAADPHAHHTTAAWPMPPMRPGMTMLPGMQGRVPAVAPFLPEAIGTIPEARPRQLARLTDGDTLALDAGLVRRRIRGRDLVMYGFNGQHPGPLIYVPEGATVVVEFTNHTAWPTAIHWHGVRLDNRFDGVPGVTQEPVAPGASFTYKVFFRDAGIYWYHPHHREDIFQDLGLYGNMLVRPAQEGYFGPVNREEVLMLDDLLLGDEGLIPYGEEASNFTMMGRFGNVFLVNGEPDFALPVQRGEVVRFFLTNVANTRTFNVSFGGLPIKVIGSDVGLFERDVWTESVVLAPAERYIVEVQFPEAGVVPLMNRVQAVNHRLGQFVAEVDTMAHIRIDEQLVAEDFSEPFDRLREHADVVADIDTYRAAFDRPVDHELVLTVEAPGVPLPVRQLMRLDAVYANPVEWGGTMPMMNWLSTGDEVHWILRDPATGLENMDIDWRFQQGDVVKLRLTNDRDAFHAMQHPVHLHGQRFLVLSVNGVPSDNLVWKDTVLLPAGATADILLDLANPGAWMLHCHIAEHLSSGMKLVFLVE